MKSKFSKLIVGLALSFSVMTPAIAQVVVSSSTSTTVVAPVQSPVVSQVPASDFLSQVLAAIKGFGGLSTLMKVTGIIVLLVASMKVSILNKYVWSKLGGLQSVVGAALGLVAGVLGLFGGGAPITIASVFAYLGAGVGATGLHELLDDIKLIPGIGSVYVSVINAVESVLGGPASQAASTAPQNPPSTQS